MTDTREYRIPALRERVERDYEAVKRQFSDNGLAFDMALATVPPQAITNTSVDYIGLNIYAAGDKHDLAGVIRALRVNGFKLEGEPPAKSTPSWTGFFYNLARACIYVSFSSKVCRRVKVGTKMIEQDVYETVCDETTLPEHAA